MLKKIDSYLKKINKRIRFVAATFILSFIILISTFFTFENAIFFIPLFVLVTYFFTYFSILEGIKNIEKVMLFIVPIFFVISFYLFYLLFPIRWLTRLPYFVIFAVSLYAILLASNIFNVGVQKGLQLFRAAFSINFFYQVLIIFLILNVFFSFRLNFIFNSLGIFFVIFPLSIQFLWSVKPKIQLDRQIVVFAALISIILMELTSVFSFIPLRTSIFALLIATCYYSLSGLIYSFLDERLFKETIREYLIVLAFVVVVVVLSISW